MFYVICYVGYEKLWNHIFSRQAVGKGTDYAPAGAPSPPRFPDMPSQPRPCAALCVCVLREPHAGARGMHEAYTRHTRGMTVRAPLRGERRHGRRRRCVAC